VLGGETKMNDYVEANNDRLWLNEEFRRQYPLTAQSLKELDERQQADFVYRQYTEIFQSLHDAADKLSAMRVPDFSQKYLQEQDMGEIPGEQKSNEPPGRGMLEGPVSKALGS
jgi:hypothetical protein